jgi:ADP-ribose pyrophosphatase YjhB (NUDIX family)
LNSSVDKNIGNRRGNNASVTKFNISAFVVIFDKKDRVLLSHRRDMDIWTLPGGSVENGELPNEAAVRETKEETGLKVKVDDLVGVYSKPDNDKFSFVFLGEVESGKLKKSKEADKHRYFKVKKIPKNTIPKHVRRVKDAAKNNHKPVFRQRKSLSARKLLKKLKKKK